ncbi:unnamed protein product [Notodromas monacha]|uniref:CCR4-NOT transcription complex subunit 1 n=1 Tax=Notodromas monacha TaxID=399045 RepID=A0A7R9G9U4_9CRUS|nr:unnamed protein product [Notodromas monacha]CAG0913001.1 unnamed protein product [Notodromas monacha]
MNLDPLSIALNQITNAVENLTKKNFKAATQEITYLVHTHGNIAERHLIWCLFLNLDFAEQIKSAPASGGVFLFRETPQTLLLSSLIGGLLEQPLYSSVLCHAYDSAVEAKNVLQSTSLLPSLAKLLRLNEVQEVVFAFQLSNASRAETVSHAAELLKYKLPELRKLVKTAVKSTNPGEVISCSFASLFIVLESLSGNRAEQFGLTTSERSEFCQDLDNLVRILSLTSMSQQELTKLKKDASEHSELPVLTPIFPSESEPSMECLSTEESAMARSLRDNCLADQFFELGFAITQTREECKLNMMKINMAERVSPRAIANMLALMIRSQSIIVDQVVLQNVRSPANLWSDKDKLLDGLQSQGWNIENFVLALSDIAPSLSWKDVVIELENVDFEVKDRTGLVLLMGAFNLGLRLQHTAFPIEHLYKPWARGESQLQLMQQVLKNPDVFTLSDHPHTPVSVEMLKSPSDAENKEVAMWKSLDLIKLLLHQYEAGNHSQVSEVMKFPMTHCPDVLALGLMQAQNGSIRPIVIEAMAEWYRRGDGDQQRLSRILEVAHDLKALSSLLSARPFPFVIDLACVASRREYLKLDKWLTDKIRDHGDVFITAVAKFVQRKCPQLVSGEDDSAQKSTLPSETVSVILQCLQSFASASSAETQELIASLSNNFSSVMLPRLRQPFSSNASLPKPDKSFIPSEMQDSFVSSFLGLNLPNSMSGVDPVGMPMSQQLSSSSQLSVPSMNMNTVPMSGGQQFSLASSPSAGNRPSAFTPLASQLPADVSKLFPDILPSTTKDVEDEANSYFQRLYQNPNPQMSVDEVLQMLKKFQDSDIKRERDVYSCMLRNLFEEYRFFPQYPMKELNTTAQLFGGIIEYGLVTYMALGIALRYVLEALRKPKGNKMNHFGLVALERFRNRLKDYPQYCQHVATIPHFSQFPEVIIEYVEYGSNSKEPPSAQHQSTLHTMNLDFSGPMVMEQNPGPMARMPNSVSSSALGIPNPGFPTAPVQNQIKPPANPTTVASSAPASSTARPRRGLPLPFDPALPTFSGSVQNSPLHEHCFKCCDCNGGEEGERTMGNLIKPTEVPPGLSAFWGSTQPQNPVPFYPSSLERPDEDEARFRGVFVVDSEMRGSEYSSRARESRSASNIRRALQVQTCHDSLRNISNETSCTSVDQGRDDTPENEEIAVVKERKRAFDGMRRDLNHPGATSHLEGQERFPEKLPEMHCVGVDLERGCNPGDERSILRRSPPREFSSLAAPKEVELFPRKSKTVDFSLLPERTYRLDAEHFSGSGNLESIHFENELTAIQRTCVHGNTNVAHSKWDHFQDSNKPDAGKCANDGQISLRDQAVMESVCKKCENFPPEQILPLRVDGLNLEGFHDPHPSEFFCPEPALKENTFLEPVFQELQVEPYQLQIDDIDWLNRLPGTTRFENDLAISHNAQLLSKGFAGSCALGFPHLHGWDWCSCCSVVKVSGANGCGEHICEDGNPGVDEICNCGLHFSSSCLLRFCSSLRSTDPFDNPSASAGFDEICTEKQDGRWSPAVVEESALMQTTYGDEICRGLDCFGEFLTMPSTGKTGAFISESCHDFGLGFCVCRGLGQPSNINGIRCPSIANATNIDTLLVATEKEENAVALPPEHIQEKIAFIFNNLSQLNLQNKSDEMRDIVSSDEYWPYVAQYLVMKRSSIEPNFHHLYSNFLDTLKLPRLNTIVLKETYRNIKILLHTSDKGIANFSDRSLLKNLGHWLGMLTLAKNKPILFVDLDLRSLLIEAYMNGQQELLYVVPFVAKIIESCSKSRVFKPPNPWTMCIMSILAELHQEPDLKLNLKFEIEVLCKNLKMEVSHLKPSRDLKDVVRLTKMENQINQAKKNEGPVMPPMSNLVLHGMQNTPVLGDMEAQLANMIPASMLPGTATAATVPHAGTTTSPPPPTAGGGGPHEMKFNYHSVNISSLSNMCQNISISAQVLTNLNMQNTPQQVQQVKQSIKMAIEKAAQEWLPTFVDRSVKIALSTSEHVVRKDFALDPDESRMRLAAHRIARQLTGSLGWITCREHLTHSVINNLKNTFSHNLNLSDMTDQQRSQIDEAATIATGDNIDSACAFIQKTAMETVTMDIDKRLRPDFELRKRHRMEGRRYCDPAALKYQAERLPEQVRSRVGVTLPAQMAIYEYFNNIIPGFQPLIERDQMQYMPKQLPTYGQDDVTLIYDSVINDVSEYLKTTPQANALMPHITQLENMLDALYNARTTRDPAQAIQLVQIVVEGLLEQNQLTCPDLTELIRFREAHVFVLRNLQCMRACGSQVIRYVTKFWIESREEVKWNLEIVDMLIRNNLLNMGQFDFALGQAMEGPSNFVAFRFAMQLIQNLLVDDRCQHVSESDFPLTLEVLHRVASHNNTRSSPENEMLFESRMINMPGVGTIGSQHGNVSGGPGGVSPSPGGGLLMPGMVSMPPPSSGQSINTNAPSTSNIFGTPGHQDYDVLQERLEHVVRDWIGVHMQTANDADLQQPFHAIFGQLLSQGIFRSEENVAKFLRVCINMCSQLCSMYLGDSNTGALSRNKCYQTIDAIEALFVMMVRNATDVLNFPSKISVIHKVFTLVGTAMVQEEESKSDFHPLTYQRMLTFLFHDFMNMDNSADMLGPQVLQLFTSVLTMCQPSKCPQFAYGWLEVVAHRTTVQIYMTRPSVKQSGWGQYYSLLHCAFKFVSPFLRSGDNRRSVFVFYKGMIRILLMLLHDFPEFLSQNYIGFCDMIPNNCIQTRNVILSAFPREMHLPDPFTPNLKMEQLPESGRPPRINANVIGAIQPASFKKDLDSYLKSRRPVAFLTDLRTNLQNPSENTYNVPLINALVLYVGTQAIAQLSANNQSTTMTNITHSSHMDIFQNLAVDLDNAGRYLLFNSIANHLRYPNNHTHYFSSCLLYLFREANSKIVQEQIVRVLLERLIVNRPHPWGLLLTFIDLLRNPNFDFWSHEFVRSAPEIEKLFENVGRSFLTKSVSAAREQEKDH